MRVFLICLLMSNFSYAHINLKKTFAKQYNAKKLQMQNTLKGGAMDGGGSGANFPESGAAWFYQDKKEGHISICIKRDINFKADLTEVKRVITESFKTWDQYITDHKIYERFDDDGNPIPYDEKLKILTKIKIHEKCSKDIDVTFYFGTIDKKVQAVLDNMVNPKAFAYRDYSDIDAVKGTSKGMVYVFSPKPKRSSGGVWDYEDVRNYDWSKKNYLYAMMLHEIGHIMGVEHIPNTIMEEDFDFLFSVAHNPTHPNFKRYSKYLTNIDHHSHVLFNNEDLKAGYGSLGIIGSKQEKDSFKFFTGKELTGRSQVFFALMDLDKSRFQFHINDKKNSNHNKTFTTHNMKISSLTIKLRNDISLFKRVRKFQDEDIFGNIEYDYEIDNELQSKAILHGVTTYNNSPFGIELNFNLGNSYIQESKNVSHYVLSPLTFHFTHPKTLERTPLFYGNVETYSEEGL